MSLIEVIFALSLVGLIILFLFGLIPSAGLLGREAEHQLAATEFAGEMADRVGLVAFSTLKAADGKTLTPGLPLFLGSHLQNRKLPDGTILEPKVSLSLVPPAGRLVQAVITISWNTRRRSKTHVLVKRYSSVLR